MTGSLCEVRSTVSPIVMAGLSRPKDGVLSHAYVPAIHVFLDATLKDVDARDKRGHDRGEAMPHVTHAARWGRN